MIRPPFARLIAVAFGASGFSALIYQVAWQRVLTQVIGSDAISVVFIVTIFMTCLGIGAELARRLLARKNLSLAKVYACIEFGIGLYGFASISILRAANVWWAAQGPSTIAADAALNFLILAPPVIGMGMTTPLIIHLARDRIDNLGRTVGWLYGLNILGASVGAVVAGLVLIEALGLQGTTNVAALINLLVAAMLFAVLRKTPQSTSYSIVSPILFAHGLAAVSFGFGTLALQIALFRVAVNYFTMATMVFPIVLSGYLLLMAAGQWVGGTISDRHPNQLRSVLAGLFAAGSLFLLVSLRFPPEWAAHLGALSFTTFNGSLLPFSWRYLIGDPNPLVVFFLGGFLMLPVLFWSALFSVMIRIMTPRIDSAGTSFASLYSLYTVGNVLGTFVFGLWIIPSVGTGASMIVTAGIVCAGVMVAAGLRSPYVISGCAAGALAALLIPTDYYRSFHLDRYAVEHVYEGRNGVATTVPTAQFYKIIDMNRTASASAMVRDPGPHDQYEAWRWNLTDLLVLDQTFRPRTVLVIGIGHAYLIEALLDLPFIERIDVVDISNEVVDAVRDNTQTSTQRIFSDKRVNIIIEDGRRFVQQAISAGKTYDLIQTKINEPWHAGSGNLFTVEFMGLQKRLLSNGGYLGVRPLLGHAKDGLAVFGNAVYPEFYHVYFKKGDLPKMDRAVVTADIADAWSKLIPGQSSTSHRADHLDVLILTQSDPLPPVDHNTDDRPTFEYYKLRQWLGRWHSPRLPLDGDVFKHLRRSIPVTSTTTPR